MATLETFTSGSKSISVEVSTPAKPARYPAVLVIYGTDGLQRRERVRNCDSGSSPPPWPPRGSSHSFPTISGSTGTAPGVDTAWPALTASRDTWVKCLADAANYADGRPDVLSGKLGIVGFSLGGNLALRLAEALDRKPKGPCRGRFLRPDLDGRRHRRRSGSAPLLALQSTTASTIRSSPRREHGLDQAP